ncbi:MAG: hypothetical protein QWI36_03050 [Wolbachia endosymbiont of Tyrophagus putrescentiae]|nr:hypothetical protein [Wolbachia endosymbiont of Tyrophagus putrescentiae]MDN5249851.1 hypothetical protein [Alphaproteobacteria bacterium]
MFSGKTVVFTGTLSTMERKEAQEKAESLGAKVNSNVSGNTNFLVVGDKSGSKYKRALKLKTRMITEEEWIACTL